MMRSTNDDAILDYIPKWGRIWIVISSLLVICDFCYVLCHPHSFPDGKWGSYLPFTLWHNYAKWDLRYANPNDTFNYVQSLLNVLEMILGLYLSFPPPISTTTTTTTKALNSSSSSSSIKVRQAQMLVVVEICTCYKTIIYFGMEIISGFEYTKHNHPMMIVLVALFSLPWIVVPAILAKTIMDRLLVFMMNNNNNNNIPSSSSSSPPFRSEEGKKKE